MIIDNSGIHYSRMLLFLFGFLLYWKIEQRGHVKVVKKIKCDVKDINF